jgi:hypothetical protein
MMATSYAELRRLSRADLEAFYDATAENTVVGLAFLREEIARREFEEQNERMLKWTREIRNLTRVITLLTIFNVLLVAVTLLVMLCDGA